MKELGLTRLHALLLLLLLEALPCLGQSDGSGDGYKIFLYKAGYAGETGPFHPPGSFYEGHRREGAVKCKPYMNSNF